MIYVECEPDNALVRFLINIPRREVRHELKGKGEICNRLKKISNCTGIVDEDPSSGQPRFLKEARLEEDLAEEGIRVLRHEATHNRLIVICPKLEEWILNAARQVNIDVRGYDLPNDPRRLHGQINLNLGKFGELLEALRDSSSRLRALRRLLQE